MQKAARQRQRNIDRLGQMRDLFFGLRIVVELNVFAECVEEIPSVVELEGRRICDRVTPEPPQKDSDIRDVVLAASRFDATHVNRARHFVKRSVDEIERLRIAHIRNREILETHVIHILRSREQLKIFDYACVPIR